MKIGKSEKSRKQARRTVGAIIPEAPKTTTAKSKKLNIEQAFEDEL